MFVLQIRKMCWKSSGCSLSDMSQEKAETTTRDLSRPAECVKSVDYRVTVLFSTYTHFFFGIRGRLNVLGVEGYLADA